MYERSSAFRSFDARRSRAGRAGKPAERSQELRYGRRALALLKSGDEAGSDCDYVITDTHLPPGTARPRRCVVYLQQRFMGLPVYDGRRSVIFTGRLVEVTGKRIPVRNLPRLSPATTAESSVQAAFTQVYGKPCPAIEKLCAFASPERFVAFRGEGLSLATAHLAVFPSRRTDLAWVVDLTEQGGPRFEIVLDALTLALLRSRMTSQSADACITLPPAEPTGAQVFFEPAWTASGAVGTTFNNKSWTPPLAVGGTICSTTVKDLHALNAFCLSNRAFDVCSPLLALSSPLRVAIELFGETIQDGAHAAFADGERVVLRGVTGPPKRFAALDPSVVIHEVSHVVLNSAVGGSAFANPFESEGESRAVSEGLADFLGLTIWNAILRSMTPSRAGGEVFGPSFLAAGRDYSAYFAGDGPAMGAATEAHDAGMALCGALLQARAALIEDHDLGEDEADEALWAAVCRGLPLLPHQGDLPNFCCVRKVVSEAIAPAALRATFDDAVDDIGIPGHCPHIT